MCSDERKMYEAISTAVQLKMNKCAADAPR
jgi:hypothetical protein